MSKWIDVNEKLPKDDKVVLAFMPNGFIQCVYWSGTIWKEVWGDKFKDVNKPIYWAPLLKFPNKKGVANEYYYLYSIL